MTLSDYIKKRNGVPMGHSKSLPNNLYRSLGAANFSLFWNYWNPIFSFYLGTKVFRPLRKKLPSYLAVVITFIVCGLIHDVVTTVARGRTSLFFTVWFFLMSCWVIIAKMTNYNLRNQLWLLRAIANLSIIVSCFYLTKALNSILLFY